MPSRRRSREKALQILYLRDMREESVPDAIAEYGSLADDEGETEPETDLFAEELVSGAALESSDIDERITAHSEHWKLERMPVVDRNILRLAIYEMVFVRTPPAVVIDEALELARRFSGESSRPFINGVLDAVARDLPEQAMRAKE